VSRYYRQICVLALLIRCAGDPDEISADVGDAHADTDSGEVALAPVLSLATLNCGTTPGMVILAPSPLRIPCSTWYCNDLCTLDSEAVIAAAIDAQRPDVLMLEEVWDQRRCQEADRPPEIQAAPYACAAGDEHQLTRLLPQGYSYACVHGDRDTTTCVAFRDAVFEPRDPAGAATPCAGRDCSALMEGLGSDYEHEGTMATLRGLSAAGPTTLGVVHLWAAASGAAPCRALQIEALGRALGALPKDEILILAGDFNLDPIRWTGPDVDALSDLATALGFTPLPTPARTNQVVDAGIDLILTRGWADPAEVVCDVTFLDAQAEVPMIDHGWVGCRR
jgi:hypothetical protein